MLKMYRSSFITALGAFICTFVLSATAAASDAGSVVASPSRQLTMLRFAVQEYREGVAGGVVIDAHELATAEALIDELRGQAPSPEIERLAALVAARAGQDEVERAFRRWLELHGQGIEPERPQLPPAVAEGGLLFARYCVSCHGAAGDGRGPIADAIEGPRPADFTDPGFMHDETPAEFYQAISIGVPGSGMPSWDGLLTPQERWDIVAFLWSLHRRDSSLAGRECSSCHGSDQGRAALDTSDSDVLAALLATDEHRRQAVIDASGMVALVRDRTFVAARNSSPSQTRAASGKHTLASLDLVVEEYRDAVAGGHVVNAVEYGEARAFLAALSGDIEALDGSGRLADGSRAREATEELGRLLYGKAPPVEFEAVAAALRAELLTVLDISAGGLGGLEAAGRLLDELEAGLGDPVRTRELVLDAYLAFEGIEKRLALRAPQLVARIEADFVRLRARIAEGQAGPADIEAVRFGLVEASGVMVSGAVGLAPFFNSLVIILREGMEAILIISALAAYLLKGGHMLARRWLYEGAAGGVFASLVTALVVDRALAGSALAVELIEGVTMLVASVVLFSVSYWLISKLEARHWQAYIRGQLDRALGRSSRLAMAGVAFLAVYREGFETVLFYRALSAEVTTLAPVIAGFVLGLSLLGGVYLAITRFSVNIPLRPFFSITGAFLYLMAFRFAGAGVGELQEAGVLDVTAASWWPELPALGMSPNLETALAQALLLGAAVLAALAMGGSSLRQRARG